MGRINSTRVLLGGLLAGVVINVGEGILNGVILLDDYQANMEQYQLVEADWAMVGYLFSAFLLGFVIAWLYAAIRPRFGPGWKTGAIAGAAVWAAAYLTAGIWFGAIGLAYGVGITLLALLWGLVEMALAGVAAGWVYQEGTGEVAAAEPVGAAPSAPAGGSREPAAGAGDRTAAPSAEPGGPDTGQGQTGL